MERDELLSTARQVMVAEKLNAGRLVFVEEMGTNTALSSLYAWAKKGRRAYCSVLRNRGKNATMLASMNVEGMLLAVIVSTAATVFEAYVEGVLCPNLKRGQVVVMDTLSAHKGEWVKKLIEKRGASFSTFH